MPDADVEPGDIPGNPLPDAHKCAGDGHGNPLYGFGGYNPYPAARANSAAARSAARFLRIRFMDDTDGAVAFVHTPERQEKEKLFSNHFFFQFVSR